MKNSCLRRGKNSPGVYLNQRVREGDEHATGHHPDPEGGNVAQFELRLVHFQYGFTFSACRRSFRSSLHASRLQRFDQHIGDSLAHLGTSYCEAIRVCAARSCWTYPPDGGSSLRTRPGDTDVSGQSANCRQVHSRQNLAGHPETKYDDSRSTQRWSHPAPSHRDGGRPQRSFSL